MELPQDYFSDLASAAWRFAAGVLVLAAGCFVLRRRLHSARLARAFRTGLLVLVYVIVAAVVLDAFMSRWGFRGDAPNHGFSAMLDRSADRPFVYRVLSPTIVNAGTALVPAPAVERLRPWLLERSPLRRYRAPFETWTAEKALAWHVAYFYLFVSLLLTLVAARSLTRTATSGSPLFVDYAPAVALLLLPLTFLRGGYFYDFPELAFLFAATLFAMQGRWTAFSLLFPFAVLNKESDVLLLTSFVAIASTQLPKRRWRIHAAVLAVVGVGIVAALRVGFADSGGGSTQPWFPMNVLFFLSPEWYAKFFTPFAPLIPIPRGLNALSLLAIAFIVLWRWAEKPLAFRRLLLANAAVTLPLYLLFGFLDEIRALSLLFPALYLHACFAVLDVYGPENTAEPLQTT